MQYIHLKDGTHIAISDVLLDLDRGHKYQCQMWNRATGKTDIAWGPCTCGGGVLVLTVVNDWRPA